MDIVVNELCSEIVYENFVLILLLGGQAGGSGYVAVYYTLISRIFAPVACVENYILISQYRISPVETAQLLDFFIYILW